MLAFKIWENWAPPGHSVRWSYTDLVNTPFYYPISRTPYHSDFQNYKRRSHLPPPSKFQTNLEAATLLKFSRPFLSSTLNTMNLSPHQSYKIGCRTHRGLSFKHTPVIHADQVEKNERAIELFMLSLFWKAWVMLKFSLQMMFPV